MDKTDSDLAARLAALKTDERDAVLAFLSQPVETETPGDVAGELSQRRQSDDSARPAG